MTRRPVPLTVSQARRGGRRAGSAGGPTPAGSLGGAGLVMAALEWPGTRNSADSDLNLIFKSAADRGPGQHEARQFGEQPSDPTRSPSRISVKLQ